MPKFLYTICCLGKKSDSVPNKSKEGMDEETQTNSDGNNLSNDEIAKEATEFLHESDFYRR